MSFSGLSTAERRQLGTSRIGFNGKPTRYRHPTAEEWPALRALLVRNSLRSNPRLDVSLTAYTPGETLRLIRKPVVRAWHARYRKFRVPDEYPLVVFVPCAKTKPWAGATRGLYASYNAVKAKIERGELPKAYFVTLSEPLGIVPQSRWGDFPQYDNPGLFHSNVMRSSLFVRDWLASPFGAPLEIPFDNIAYRKSIAILGEVIADFVDVNSDKTFLSFVEDATEKSTHSDMLDYVALREPGAIRPEHRYAKRPAARQAPQIHLEKTLAGYRN